MREKVGNFERVVEWTPAFDKRSTEPGKNYGIGAADMRWVLIGEKGAVQFLLYTGWYLPHNMAEMRERFDFREPLPSDIGYHSYVPHYDGHDSMGPCRWLNGAECYYDGSSLNAVRYFNILVSEGEEALWSAMEEFYNYHLLPEKQTVEAV